MDITDLENYPIHLSIVLSPKHPVFHRLETVDIIPSKYKDIILDIYTNVLEIDFEKRRVSVLGTIHDRVFLVYYNG